MRKRRTFLATATLAIAVATGLATAIPAAASTSSAQELNISDGCYAVDPPIDCTITEPVVNQPQYTYPLSFARGDHVIVEAGGCVQTGGSGRTWKRYVDPASDNDLYHGLISIPGVTNGLVRISSIVGRELVVGGRGGSLILGYEDDGYGDNGYYSHDNGTGDQCLNSVNAFVHIVIT